MKLKTVPLASIKPYERNPRRNDGAVDAVAESIRQCSYVAPIIVDEHNVILAGHTRWKALQKLGHTTAKVCIAEGLSEEQKRKYRILDNKTAEIAEWDDDLLRIELDGLDFEGFDFGLLDLTAEAEQQSQPEIAEDDFDPEPPEEPVAQRGQVWQLGRHRLMCGDATSLDDVQTCTGGATRRFAIHRSTVWGRNCQGGKRRRRISKHAERNNRRFCRLPGQSLSACHRRRKHGRSALRL